MKYAILTLLSLLSIHLMGQMQKGSDIMETNGSTGWSVAMSASGDTIAVGAPTKNGAGENRGEVRAYVWNGVDWVRIGAPIEGINDFDLVGWNVSMSESGKRISIGFLDNFESGSVRIYELVNGEWEQIAYFRTPYLEDSFGYSQSLSGDGRSIAIGAYTYEDNDNRVGRVEVYKEQGLIWELVGEPIKGLSPHFDSHFGFEVDISRDGSIVAVSNPRYIKPGEPTLGVVFLYRYENDSWIPHGGGSIFGSNLTGSLRGYGSTISLSANGTAIGIGHPDAIVENEFRGIVEVWSIQNDTVEEIGPRIIGSLSEENFGFSVALSNDNRVLAVGSIRYMNGGIESGALQVYEFINQNWNPTSLLVLGDDEQDLFGFDVSMNADGNSVIVGAPGKDSEFINQGQAKVYEGFRLINSTDNYNQLRLTVYPNPTFSSSQVAIRNGWEGDLTLSVRELNGKVILERRFFKVQDVVSLDISSLPSGPYILTLRSADETASGRVLIE